jgi:hypothetical protein
MLRRWGITVVALGLLSQGQTPRAMVQGGPRGDLQAR